MKIVEKDALTVQAVLGSDALGSGRLEEGGKALGLVPLAKILREKGVILSFHVQRERTI
jgi:hypothetical protein